MEVMIAMGIFFIAVFAILELVSTNLRNARRLQMPPVDASLPLAQIYLNPPLEAGESNGDFGDLYKDYTWTSTAAPHPVNGQDDTNGLTDITIYIHHPDGTVERAADTIMWIPNFKQPMRKL